MSDANGASWASELFLLRAEGRGELASAADRLRKGLDHRNQRLCDLAYSVSAELEPGGETLAVVASSREDLERKLAHASERLAYSDCRRIKERSGVYYFSEPLARDGKLALLFPGEGSQYPGMLADLRLHLPEMRRWFDLVDEVFLGAGRDYRPSELIFSRDGDAEHDLWRMDRGSEAVFIAEQGMHRLLRTLEIRAEAVVGHSTGEYSALLASGAIPMADDQELVGRALALNRLYQAVSADGDIGSGVLLATTGLDEARIAPILDEFEGRLYLAMSNCPSQLVFCALQDAGAIEDRLRDAGAVVVTLPFERAYHTPLFGRYCESLVAFFDELEVVEPKLELYSATAAARFPADPNEIRSLAAHQYERTVRFRETVEAMYDDGVRIFVEVGPRATLTGFVQDTLRRRPHLAVATNAQNRSDVEQLMQSLGLLAAHGVPLSLDSLYASRGARRPEAAGPSSRATGAEVTLSLSLPTLTLPVWPRSREPARGDRDEFLERYFVTMDRFLRVQARVAEAALGQAVAATASEPAQLEPEAAQLEAEREHQTEDEQAAVPEAPAEDVAATVIRLVSEKTGYPPAMIQADLDLEAELGIDSIKRVEILGALQDETGRGAPEDIEELVSKKTIAEICEYLGSGGSDERRSSEPPRAEHLPLIDEITAYEPGASVSALRRLDPEEDRFLLDHTLGRARVDGSEERGLPILPLAMMIEALAEAGSLVVPDQVVVAVRRVRAHRFVALPEGPVTVRLSASRRGDEADARLELVDGEGDAGDLVAEGTTVFAAEYPAAPRADRLPLSGETAAQLADDELYARAMFNGPALQGVESLESSATDGMRAKLRVPPVEGLFASRSPGFVTDPVLLDAAGQVVGFWTAERLESGFVVFPFAAEEISFFGGQAPPGTSLRCDARIALDGETLIDSALVVAEPDGTEWMTIRGWEDKRFPISRRVARFALGDEVHLSDECRVFPAARHVVARRLDLAGEIGSPVPELWLEALAALVLTHGERDRWRELPRGRRRQEWLAGRLAAKEAVSAYLAETHGMEPAPSEVAIDSDPSGRPFAGGRWLTTDIAAPAVSITHSNGVAIAAAGGRGDRIGLGVDLEVLERAHPPDPSLAISEPERALLGAAGTANGDGLVRLWCIKEAAAKALGTGLRGRPDELRIRELDVESGKAAVAVDGRGAIDVWTRMEEDMVIAGAVADHG